MTQDRLTGGCTCKAVSYEITGDLGFSFLCQCRSCQQSSGTGHTATFMCERAHLSLTGDLSWYERVAPSGNTIRAGFCPTCGSPVLTENSGYEEHYFVAAGGLDDPEKFKPRKILFRDESCSWDLKDPELEKKDR